MRKQPNARWMRQHMIASTDTGRDFFSSGLQAVVDGDEAGVIGYSCDSYYGIELGTDVNYDGELRQADIKRDHDLRPLPIYDWMWEGTKEELFYAAKHCTDLMFPNRPLNPEDSDYDEMMKLYTAIRTYLRKQERRKKQRKKYGGPNVSKVFDKHAND